MDVPSSSSSAFNFGDEEILADAPNWHTGPSSSNWEYDVFLSFRGEDTRNAFTDHLYDCMNRNGIDTFRDTENLPRGKSISPLLLKAIEESTFAVIVLSTHYANSTWCLDELAHILECKKLRGLEVVPVFYHVEPSEIRKQTGNYGKAFAKHEKDFKHNISKVNKWRRVLKDVADFSGWHVTPERSEREVIQEITNHVSKEVGLSIPQNHFIGMDSRIREVESRLDLGSIDVLTIGIWGMGGIGKTTLAKEVFKKIRDQFHPSGFVSQVRLQSEVEFLRLLCKSFPGNGNINFDTVERGIKLLKKALRKNKVLIVLDDVDDFKQIKCLAPGELLGLDTWGGGSRLIITSRDRSVWRDFRVPENQIYEVEKLSNEEAYQLLCQKAFKKDNPPDEFVQLSKSLLQYAGGIPLAHEVLGSYLSKQSVDEWSEILHRLDDDKDKDIFSVLQISFDGLQETDKKIFLDIACFFNGEDHVRVKKILEGCGFSVRIGIRNLINKSLIKIDSNNELWMHDLLRCLGWHIVHEESRLPGTRSRLWVDGNAHKYESRRSWRFEDARNVLEENAGTPAVEGLFLSLPKKEKMQSHGDPILKMPNLRLLKIYNVNFLGVHLTYLSKHLRLLEWHECPLESLPSSFKADRLVEFKMPNSRIKQLWNETLNLELLILVDLSNCQYLATTPDFSKVPNLERLILEGCTELSEVHPTIGDLQHLVLLNLKGCTNLVSLPPSISLRSLHTCILSRCSKLRHFPEIVGNMRNLSELYLDGTAIRELPVSIQHLPGLILLNLSGCKNLLNLPSVLCSSLTSLKFLNLSLCSSMEKLPENIGFLKHLEELDACDTAIRKVPESISGLKNLKLLCFHGCSKPTSLQLPNSFSGLSSLTTLNLGGCNLADGAIPDDIGYLFSLQSLDLSENNFLSIPESISQLSELEEISFHGCGNLQSLPKNPPESVENVDVRGCHRLTTSHGWRRLASCNGLNIINCRQPVFVELHKFPLEKLEELDLSNCQHLTKIPDLKKVPNLKKLNLEGCKMLSKIHPTVWGLQHLALLNLKGCVNQSRSGLPEVLLRQSIYLLSSLRILDLSGNNFESIPNEIGRLSSLQRLYLGENNFVSIPESIITQLYELTELGLFRCSKLQSLPQNLPFNLKFVDARACPMLKNYADSLTIWGSAGFCFIYCGKSDQDRLPLPVLKDRSEPCQKKKKKRRTSDYLSSELLFPKFIEDRIYGKQPFEIRIPYSPRIPNLCSHWRSGPCVEIQLSDSHSHWMGFALFVVFEILQKYGDSCALPRRYHFEESWELEETICNFYTHDGQESFLVLQNIDVLVGSSCMLCFYVPRGGQFGGLLDKARARLRASVTTKRLDLKVRGCAIHPIISQQDAAEFVQNLTNETVAAKKETVADQHLDFNFCCHCEDILNETTTGDLMELDHDLQKLGSTPTVNQDNCSKSNPNAHTQPRGELSKLYEGRNRREESFHFCFPAPVISIPPWFVNHHAGDVTLCYVTENLLDDQAWMGLELYVVFTRRTSASSEGVTSFFFHVDLCANDHEVLVMHGSLKIDSCLGTSEQLVVLHVPRVHFQQQWNQCQGISALFRTINPEMEVLVCGSRLVFEQDWQDLIHSLTAAVMSPFDLEEQQVDQRNAVKGEMPIKCHSWFQRSTAQVVAEQAPPSSIRRLRDYRCYLQQKQGFVKSDPTLLLQSGSVILFHSKGGRFFENRDSNQEYAAEEDTASWLACDHHVRINIMAETLFYGSYGLQQWRRRLLLLLQYSKAATLSLGGHTISALKRFNPSSTYNICFSDDISLAWSMVGCRMSSAKPTVRMKLPPKLCDDNNWRGLVVCAVFRSSKYVYRGATTSSSGVQPVCHLRSNDHCLNPMPTCSVAADKFFEQVHLGTLPRLTWLTYIPRALLTEFNMVSDVEASIYINCPRLTVHTCSISLLYQQQEEELQKFITDHWTSFLDQFPLIRQLVDADENVHQRRPTKPMLESHVKDFDRDLIYNATLPSMKIPKWFGELGRQNCFEVHLPSPCSDEDWIGLALCASYHRDLKNSYLITCRLHTKKNGFNNYHEYETTNEECESLKPRLADRHFIWLSYIPRRWFLHQLNDESVLVVSFHGRGWPAYTAGHRFVYEHNVEEFKQLCIDLHNDQKSE